MKRKLTERLVAWKENKNAMPLLLMGARQTGKTYLLQEFCKSRFEKNLYINLEESRDHASFFEDTLNPEDILRRIEAYRGEKISIENTVIFFDEIQVSERAIASLKYFNESEKGYRIVCAGSLLGVQLNRLAASFPVGKVSLEQLFPMDFEEFLLAVGEELLVADIRDGFEKMRPLNEALHRKALQLYRTYLCSGGMPQAILEFMAKNRDMVLYDRSIHQNIIYAYLADMAKYTTGTQAVKTSQVYNSIPAQLAKENKKFMYKLVHDKAKKEGYESAIEWLIQSGMLLKAIRIDLPQAPLLAYQKPNFFKLYLSDVGLLTALCKFNFGEILLETSLIYRGVLTENYVAQTFKRAGHDLLYWESNAQAEVDFLLNLNGSIIPVEVKAADNTASKSLQSYRERYRPDHAIRVSAKNFGFVNGIKAIPLYAVHCIGL